VKRADDYTNYSLLRTAFWTVANEKKECYVEIMRNFFSHNPWSILVFVLVLVGAVVFSSIGVVGCPGLRTIFGGNVMWAWLFFGLSFLFLISIPRTIARLRLWFSPGDHQTYRRYVHITSVAFAAIFGLLLGGVVLLIACSV